MTRIWVISDLHDDNNRTTAGNYALPKDVEADVIVIAGDVAGRLSRMGRSFLEAQDRGIPILVVPGNHDFWRGSLEQEVQRFRDRQKNDFVHILDAETMVVAGTRFIGATLWTDYLCFHGDVGRAMHEAKKYLNDHKFIRSDGYKRRLKPAHLAQLHAEHRGFIEETLEKPFAGPTVVVTHHAPSPRSLRAGRVTEPLDAAYASDLEPLIERLQPDLWIHGHVHAAQDYEIGATRVVCNPRGYVSTLGLGRHRRLEVENAGFDERLVVEVGMRPQLDDDWEDADRNDEDAWLREDPDEEPAAAPRM